MNLLQLYFSFKGRLSLKSYWIYWGIPMILFISTTLYLEEIGIHYGGNFWRVMNAVIIWPALATSAKRLHDINISAWWLLLNLIPVLGSLIIFILNCIMPGTKGENRFEPSIA